MKSNPNQGLQSQNDKLIFKEIPILSLAIPLAFLSFTLIMAIVGGIVS